MSEFLMRCVPWGIDPRKDTLFMAALLFVCYRCFLVIREHWEEK